jgi:SAM-dependent methyltransferase
VTPRHVGDVHNIVFDTYHGFSLQYPIDFEVFMEAAQAAGLEPLLYHQKRYPSHRPFVSICNNYFVVPKSGSVIPNGASLDRGQGWHPTGTEDMADGEALHHLLYRNGDLRRPKPWCAGSAAPLLRQAVDAIEDVLARIREGRHAPEITILDYGTGTGFAVIELLKVLNERGVLRQVESMDVALTIHMLDIPSGWFAKGYELLKDCRYVRFASIRSAENGAFLPLASVVGAKRMDLVIASMVFHLIPRSAFSRLFCDLAAVLRDDGILLWHSPDIGPAPADAVLFHEPNRRLRREVIRLMNDPGALAAIVDRVPDEERDQYRDLSPLLRDAGRRLTPQARAAAQAAADRQILPAANDAGTIEQALAPWFEGEIFTRSFEMRPDDSIRAMLIPSNQRYLPEIENLQARAQLTSLLMHHAVLPALCESLAGTAYGFSMHWTYGRHALKARPLS